MTQFISPVADENSAEPPPTEELIVQRNGSMAQHVALSSPVVTLGRDVRNDIVLDTEAVSRLHARLESDQGIWYLTDLGSTNGTYLNTEKLSPYAPQAVKYNDEMKLGDFDIVLQIPGFSFGSMRPEGTVRIAPDLEEAEKVRQPIEDTVTAPLEAPISASDEIETPEFAPTEFTPSEAEFIPTEDELAEEPKDETVDQISLARQLFGGLDDYKLKPLPELPTMPMAPIQNAAPKAIPYSFSIWPLVLLNSGQVMISILNESNKMRSFEIEVLGADGVAVAQEHFSAEIPAGSEHRERVNLQTTSRPFMGDQRKYPYKVRVSAEGGEVRESAGDILVEPRLTTAMVIFAVGLSVTLALIWIASQLL